MHSQLKYFFCSSQFTRILINYKKKPIVKERSETFTIKFKCYLFYISFLIDSNIVSDVITVNVQQF